MTIAIDWGRNETNKQTNKQKKKKNYNSNQNNHITISTNLLLYFMYGSFAIRLFEEIRRRSATSEGKYERALTRIEARAHNKWIKANTVREYH